MEESLKVLSELNLSISVFPENINIFMFQCQYSFGRLIRNITEQSWQIIVIKGLSEVSFLRHILNTHLEDSVGIFVWNI